MFKKKSFLFGVITEISLQITACNNNIPYRNGDIAMRWRLYLLAQINGRMLSAGCIMIFTIIAGRHNEFA